LLLVYYYLCIYSGRAPLGAIIKYVCMYVCNPWIKKAYKLKKRDWIENQKQPYWVKILNCAHASEIKFAKQPRKWKRSLISTLQRKLKWPFSWKRLGVNGLVRFLFELSHNVSCEYYELFSPLWNFGVYILVCILLRLVWGTENALRKVCLIYLAVSSN